MARDSEKIYDQERIGREEEQVDGRKERKNIKDLRMKGKIIMYMTV